MCFHVLIPFYLLIDHHLGAFSALPCGCIRHGFTIFCQVPAFGQWIGHSCWRSFEVLSHSTCHGKYYRPWSSCQIWGKNLPPHGVKPTLKVGVDEAGALRARCRASLFHRGENRLFPKLMPGGRHGTAPPASESPAPGVERRAPLTLLEFCICQIDAQGALQLVCWAVQS